MHEHERGLPASCKTCPHLRARERESSFCSPAMRQHDSHSLCVSEVAFCISTPMRLCSTTNDYFPVISSVVVTGYDIVFGTKA